MLYGICNLGTIPMRLTPSHESEMTSQLLYGEHFKVLEKRKDWSRIRVAYDKYEGWIDNKQYQEIEEETYKTIQDTDAAYCFDTIEFITTADQQLIHIPLGAVVSNTTYLNSIFEGVAVSKKQSRENIIATAYKYLNTPYLWGGKTPFGIDCSGFTQMVYKLNGYKLNRDASQQASQGEPLSFIEESEPGDLAFFDNDEGAIVHVGIIMQDNYIIHSHGKVRIDRIDHSGIFNIDTKKHSHKLRVIKKII